MAFSEDYVKEPEEQGLPFSFFKSMAPADIGSYFLVTGGVRRLLERDSLSKEEMLSLF